LNTPPTENSVVIDANDISEELEITGLDDATKYILYAQAFVGSEAISVIVQYPFTTAPIIPDDPFGAPGAQFFVASTTTENPLTNEEETAGFFGLVSQEDFGISMADVMSTFGINQGTAQNESDPLLKFLHRGKIKYINQKTIRRTIS
jgi:hypothetical protein